MVNSVSIPGAADGLNQQRQTASGLHEVRTKSGLCNEKVGTQFLAPPLTSFVTGVSFLTDVT